MINLLPQTQKDFIRREYRLRLAVVSAVFLLIVILLALSALVPSYLLVLSKETEALTQSRSQSAKDFAIERKRLEKEAEDLNSQIALVLSPMSQSLSAKGTLDLIMAKRMPGVRILGFLYEEQNLRAQAGSETLLQVVLRGRADSRDKLLAFTDALQATPGFTSVDLPISNLSKEKDIDFSLTIMMAMKDKKQP